MCALLLPLVLCLPLCAGASTWPPRASPPVIPNRNPQPFWRYCADVLLHPQHGRAGAAPVVWASGGWMDSWTWTPS